MAETRSQALSKKAVVREVDEEIEGRFVALEKAFATQSEKTDRSIQEMVDAFKLMTRFPNQSGPSTSGEQIHQENSPRVSNPLDTQREHHHRYAQGRDYNYNGRTRLAKIDFPRFNGEKLQEWFCMVEQFFSIDNTPEESKVAIASIHFDGLARTWHQALVQEDYDAVLLRD